MGEYKTGPCCSTSSAWSHAYSFSSYLVGKSLSSSFPICSLGLLLLFLKSVVKASSCCIIVFTEFDRHLAIVIMVNGRMKLGAALGLLVLVMSTGLEVEAAKQMSCPSINDLAECKPAATTTKYVRPEKFCCIALQDVFTKYGTNGPECLCKAITSSAAKKLGVIKETALQLPQRCRLDVYKKGFVCKGSVLPGGQ